MHCFSQDNYNEQNTMKIKIVYIILPISAAVRGQDTCIYPFIGAVISFFWSPPVEECNLCLLVIPGYRFKEKYRAASLLPYTLPLPTQLLFSQFP